MDISASIVRSLLYFSLMFTYLRKGVYECHPNYFQSFFFEIKLMVMSKLIVMAI